MKIFTEVLSNQLLEDCKNDIIYNKLKNDVWCSSSHRWKSNLLKNIDGTCMQTHITDQKILENLKNELYPVLKDLKYSDIMFQYYIWDSYSGIASHDDASHAFGATIYLSTTDIVEDGGLFVWQDSECPDNLYKALLPTENMMILNDQEELHFVTPVSPHASEHRCTIQIWGIS